MRLTSGAVRFRGISPELAAGLLIVHTCYLEKGYGAVLTSVADGTHGWGSLHHSGNAADFRTSTIDRDKVVDFVAYIAAALGAAFVRRTTNRIIWSGPEWDVLLEDLNLPNEHAHLEFQPKTA
jgi:hypothetical protein